MLKEKEFAHLKRLSDAGLPVPECVECVKTDDGTKVLTLLSWGPGEDLEGVISKMPNITPHVCCHTYCSNMAKSGMNPKTLQYLMGHSDIGVTLNVYTHVGLDDASKELEKMQGLETARKEMGLSDKDDHPISQKLFKAT